MGKYNPYSYCFSTSDLFMNYDVKKLTVKNEVSLKTYGCRTRKDFCVKVFLLLICLIVLDIIENNITFVLPLKSNKDAFFYVKPIVGQELQHIKQVGGMEGINLINSNFTGYQLYFQFRSAKGNLRERPIYLSKNLKKMFYDNINKGKVYY